MSFVAIGVIGLVWLYFWQRFFADPEHQSRLGQAELEYIRSDQPQAQKALKLPWTTLMRYREIWPFLIGKLITDPVWWFYLFWLPSYLDRERGQNPLNAGIWVAVIYTGSSVGSILGGWISSTLMKRGWPVGKARMTAMGLAAIFMPGSILAYYTESFAMCVAFITLATACHQAWSANLFTNATDLFPQKVSGSVVGLGATAGGIGGMFMTLLAGLAVQWTGNQQIVFVWAGVMHVLALALFWFWFKGRFVQIDVDTPLDVSRAAPRARRVRRHRLGRGRGAGDPGDRQLGIPGGRGEDHRRRAEHRGGRGRLPDRRRVVLRQPAQETPSRSEEDCRRSRGGRRCGAIARE